MKNVFAMMLAVLFAAFGAQAKGPSKAATDAKDAKADKAKESKFWKMGHAAHDAAVKNRAAGFALIEEGAHKLALSDHEFRDSRIYYAKALAEEKASKDRIAAWEARHKAWHFWMERRHNLVMAHNYEVAARHHEHDAAELTKAAGIVKDQPDVVAALTKDAAHHTELAKHDEAEAKKHHDQATKDEAAAKAEDAIARKDEAAARGLEHAAEAPPHKPEPPKQPSKAVAAK